MRVVLLDGSPATPSRVGVLLGTIAAYLREAGHDVDVLELQALQLPVNNPAYHQNPHQHPHEAVRAFVGHVREADVLVLGTPLYHGSYSGLLKMALDHLDNDAFRGKVIGLVSNATGPRSSAFAAAALAPVARALKGDVLNRIVGTCKADYGEKDGVFQIIEPSIVVRTQLFADELAQKAGSNR